MTDFVNIVPSVIAGQQIGMAANKASYDANLSNAQTQHTNASTKLTNEQTLLTNAQTEMAKQKIKEEQLKADEAARQAADAALVRAANQGTITGPGMEQGQGQQTAPPAQKPLPQFTGQLQGTTSLGQSVLGQSQPQSGQYVPGTLQNPNSLSGMASQGQSQAVQGNPQPTQQANNPPNVNGGQAPAPTEQAPALPTYNLGDLHTPTSFDKNAATFLTGAGNTSDGTSYVSAAPPKKGDFDFAPTQMANGYVQDRMKVVDNLIKAGRGDLAWTMMQKYRADDIVHEKEKLERSAGFNSKVAAHANAILSLPEGMQESAWAQTVKDMTAAGVPIENLNNGKFDPNFIKAEAANATDAVQKAKIGLENAQAAGENMKEDTNRMAKDETARHNKVEEATNWFKAKTERQKVENESSNGGAGTVGNAYLNTLPQAYQNYLRNIATGTLKINTRNKQGAADLKAASQAFPDVNIAAAQKFSEELGKSNAGTSGGVVAGADKTLHHIETMADQDQYGSTAGKIPGLSGLINAGKNAMSIKAQAAQRSWDTAHSNTLTEIARTFKGGPAGENEVVRDMKNLKFSDPPKYKAAVYKAYGDLMYGQVKSIEDTRDTAYGSASPKTSLLNKASLERYKKIRGGTLPADATPAHDSEEAQNQRTVQQGTYTEGQTATGPNGKITYTKGQWLDANGKAVQ